MNQQIYEGVMTGASATAQVIIWTAILAVIALIGWLIYDRLQYKINYRVNILTANGFQVIDDKAKVILNKKDNTVKWKLLKRKHLVPVPKSDEITTGTKGKLFVEAYFDNNSGEYLYRKMDKPLIINNNPLESRDKVFYANEVVEAVEKYKKQDLASLIMYMLPFVTIIIIIVLFLVFFNDAVKPTIALGEQNIEIAKQNAQIYNEIHDIHNVVVGGDVDVSDPVGNDSVINIVPT